MHHSRPRLPALLALTALLCGGCIEAPLEEAEDPSFDLPQLSAGAPDCDGYDVGESWEPDACNVCFFTAQGPGCTKVGCDDGADVDEEAGAPVCGEHDLGDVWLEECNTCLCGPDGPACTRKGCDGTEPASMLE